MGLGDNFDTSAEGLVNYRTGRKSGHTRPGQDNNGGHPCNVGCGCKSVFYGVEGNCMLPNEIKIGIAKVDPFCNDSSNGKTNDKTPEDCEANNGTCLGKVANNKSDCEALEGEWQTSATWNKTSRELARAGGATEEFVLRYHKGAWRGRSSCHDYSSSRDPFLETQHRIAGRYFGKEGNIGLDTFTTHDRSPINETGRPFYDQYGVTFTPASIISDNTRERSLRPNLVDWYYNDNPYQGQLPIERQHLQNIFLMGEIINLEDHGWNFFDENPFSKFPDYLGRTPKARPNPFIEHYEKYIGSTRDKLSSSTEQVAPLPNGERFPIPSMCVKDVGIGEETKIELATTDWQVCYSEGQDVPASGGEGRKFITIHNESYGGDQQHAHNCQQAGRLLYRAERFLDQEECFERATCRTKLEDGTILLVKADGTPLDVGENPADYDLVENKWECIRLGLLPDPDDPDPFKDVKYKYGGDKLARNYWSQEWRELSTSEYDALTFLSSADGYATPLHPVEGRHLCAGEGISDTSPAWIPEMAKGFDDIKGSRQNTCVDGEKTVTLIPGIESGSVVDMGMMPGPSFSSFQRGDEAAYADIANSGFTLVIKECGYYGNCFDPVTDDPDNIINPGTGTGEVTVLYIPMDQIMNCSNLRLTQLSPFPSSDDQRGGWREQYGWWGNPAGFYPGDPQSGTTISKNGNGSYSISEKHLDWCYRWDFNDDGQADWTTGGRDAYELTVKHTNPGIHWAGKGADYDHGPCAQALYWENQIGMEPHNARSYHPPGDFALRKLNLQYQPFKATERKQNFYKSLAQAKSDRDLFNGCINQNFGSHCAWTGLAYWFEHDFVGFANGPQDKNKVCNEIGEKLQAYTRGLENKKDPGKCVFNQMHSANASQGYGHYDFEEEVCVCDGQVYYSDPDNPGSCPSTIKDRVAKEQFTKADGTTGTRFIEHECEMVSGPTCDCERDNNGNCKGLMDQSDSKLEQCYTECSALQFDGCSDTRVVSFEWCMEVGGSWGGGGTGGGVIRTRHGNNVLGRIDCGAMGGIPGIATWNIYDDWNKRTDGWDENGDYFSPKWDTPEAFAVGDVFPMKQEVKNIILDPRIVQPSKKGVGENLDYWGRTGLYPDAARSSYVVDACKGQGGTKDIEMASNTRPVIVTSKRHGLEDGDKIQSFDVKGNFAANVFTVGEWQAVQWEEKAARQCKGDNCQDPYWPDVVCPCNGPFLYGPNNEYCSGVIVKGEDPPPADFFVVKKVDEHNFALYTCDGQPLDGTVEENLHEPQCEEEGIRMCASVFASPVEVPTAQVTVTEDLVNPKLVKLDPPVDLHTTDSILREKAGETDCVEYGNCQIVDPPYDPVWSVMTELDCNRLKNNYKRVEAPTDKNKNPVYVPKQNSNDNHPCEPNECWIPLEWITVKSFKSYQGASGAGDGVSVYTACPFTGSWRLATAATPYTFEGDPNAPKYRTGWTDIFPKDSSKAENFYVWLDQEETCPVCCDHFLPNTLYATVTGDRDAGGSTEIEDYMLSGEIATTLHNPAKDICKERSAGGTTVGDWKDSTTVKEGMQGLNPGEDWRDRCVDDGLLERELQKGKLETTVPCGINKCTGKMHDPVLNYWGLPVGGRYCCDCGTYIAPLGGHGSWHQKCFDCGNAIRFDDPRWPDQVYKHADKSGDFCCDCDCDPGPDSGVQDVNALQYPTSKQVMDNAPNGCDNTIGNLTCKTVSSGKCELVPGAATCEGLNSLGSSRELTDAQMKVLCEGGATGTNIATGCTWTDPIPDTTIPGTCTGTFNNSGKYCFEASKDANGNGGSKDEQDCISGDLSPCQFKLDLANCECGDVNGDIPCFGFPDGRPMKCESETIKPSIPVGCPTESKGNWDAQNETWTNNAAVVNPRTGNKSGCGERNTYAMPTSHCYDFVPLDGPKNVGGKKDYKDGCHGMGTKTVKMEYNGSHWISDWEVMMGDSPKTKTLNSGSSYNHFVGGMSCEHYFQPDKCLTHHCADARFGCESGDAGSCQQCGGTWVKAKNYKPGWASTGFTMDMNCGGCATLGWTQYKEPPVPTPVKDAHLMRLRMGCGGAFQQYTGRDTLKGGDNYRNNQLAMFLEVTHCHYPDCNKLSVMDSFNPPCPNSFIIGDGILEVDRAGVISEGGQGGFKLGVNGYDPFFWKGRCDIEWMPGGPANKGSKEIVNGYCKLPVRPPVEVDPENDPGNMAIFPCDEVCHSGERANAKTHKANGVCEEVPTLIEHPQSTHVEYCYELGHTFDSCQAAILDPLCAEPSVGGATPDCTGLWVVADEASECGVFSGRGSAGVNPEKADINNQEWVGSSFKGETGNLGTFFKGPTGRTWYEPVNPVPYFHDCMSTPFVVGSPMHCDAQLPCTECCEFNKNIADASNYEDPANYVTCATASDISTLHGGPYGIQGSQIPEGKWINYHGGKQPENFEVFHMDWVDSYNTIGTGKGNIARLVVRKNSRYNCGWTEGTVVNTGMADRNEAETGTYGGSTRDKLSKNPAMDYQMFRRGSSELAKSIPNGFGRWGVDTDKFSDTYLQNGTSPEDQSDYMEIFVKDPQVLKSRAHVLNDHLYRMAGGYERPINSDGTANSDPWPYGDKLWPVGVQSDQRVPKGGPANDLHLEHLGPNFVRESRRGFTPTFSNILDPKRAVFLSDIPLIETNYELDANGNPDTTRPNPIYHNDLNLSLSFKSVENVYDYNESFCTNSEFNNKADCEKQGQCYKNKQNPTDPDVKVDASSPLNDLSSCEGDKNHYWVRTAWWYPKFLYTKLTTYSEHDLRDGERIIISGGKNAEATCLNVPYLHPSSGMPGSSTLGMFESPLPTGMDMEMVDQVMCEDVLGGEWYFEAVNPEKLKTGCPPLCKLDELISTMETCDCQNCVHCIEEPETCYQKDKNHSDFPKIDWTRVDLSKDNCKSDKDFEREFVEEQCVCPQASYEGGHVVSVISPTEIKIHYEATPIHKSPAVNEREWDETLKYQVCNEKSKSHPDYPNNPWISIPTSVREEQIRIFGAKGNAVTTCSSDKDFDRDLVVVMPDEMLTTEDLVNQSLVATNEPVPLTYLGHHVTLGSPKDLYRGMQYIAPTPDSDGNFGPYFGCQWSRSGGSFRIKVGQEVPLDDCKQGESSTPTMLHWLFTFNDEVCNHYLPIIDEDCGNINQETCNRGYGPYTEAIMDVNRPFGFPAQALLRVDVHEGSASSAADPKLGTKYPE